MEQEKEEQAQTETQEEEQEDALKSLLNKVDMSAPLEIPMDSGQILTITQEQFISYYLPLDATRTEKAKCFNETRAAGLNPAIRGDCHYFKTGGGPLSLFVGYHVYVRKAYANGLTHIHKPELIYDDETGALESCIITLEIEGRPDFIWETWLSEVVSEKSKGVPNARWDKAERQMLIKCSVTNIFRMAGIASIGILPPIPDEMPDFSAPGYRTLTQEQLGAHAEPEEEEITAGVVSADYHEDTTRHRKIYRGKIAEREVFADDAHRKQWQLEIIGKESTADWASVDFVNAVAEIESGSAEQWVQDKQPKPDPDPPSTGGDPNPDALPDTPEETKEEVQEEQDKTVSKATEEIVDGDWAGSADKAMDEAVKMTPETRATLTELVKNFPDGIYQTIRSQAFKTRAKNEVGRWVQTITHLTEAEGQKIIRSLESEKAGMLEEEAAGEIDGEENEPLEDGMLTPEETKEEAEKQGQLAKEQETWFGSTQYQAVAEAYKARVHKKWGSVEDMMAWQEENTGLPSYAKWYQEHFDLANAALDVEEAAARNDEPEKNTPEEDLADGDGKCNDDQFNAIVRLFSEWMPDKMSSEGKPTAHGTGTAQAFLRGVVKDYAGIRMMTTSQADDVIHALNDRKTDAKAEAKTA